mgnify:CR=1 FL=1
MEETAASSEELSATSHEIERAVRTIAQKSQEGSQAAAKISDRADITKEELLKIKGVTEVIEKPEELEAKIESIDVYVKNIRNLGNGKYSGEVHGFEPFNPAEFKNLKLGDVVEFKESEIFSCSNH